MTDLSRLDTRTTQQGRVTRRRDSIIPGRRDTNNGERRTYATMGSASRGDGGAEDLQRLFGGLSKGAASLANAQETKDALTGQKNAAKGGLDQQTDNVDPEMVRKSFQYRTAVDLGKASVFTSEWKIDAQRGGSELLARQTSGDPIEINREIDVFIEQSKRAAAMDENGGLRDFGSPEAVRFIMDQMLKETADLGALLKAQAHDALINRAMATANEAYGKGLIAGDPASIEMAYQNVPPGTPRDKLREQLILTAKVTARQIEEAGDPEHAKQILHELAYGTRYLSPADADAAPAVAPAKPGGRPTGRLPVKGAVTDAFGTRGGSHGGMDIDGVIGQGVEAPAGGTVAEVGYDKRSGHFVKIDHGNGVVSSYSHLKRASIRKGDTITSGDILGEVGNSGNVRSRGGDGSHLHYVVKVKGKPVDPQSFQFAEHSIAPVIEGNPAAPATPPRDPRPRLLPISTEGTIWSLTPEQRMDVMGELDTMDARVRRRTSQAQAERFEKGQEEVLKRYVANSPPSDGDLRALADAGHIDHRFAFTMINHNASERRTSDSEARTSSNEAKAAYATRIEIETARRVAEWSNGLGPRSYEEFIREVGKLESSGSLGPSETFASTYSRLDSAWKSGRSSVTSNPAFSTYASQLKTLAEAGMGVNLGGRGSGSASNVAHALTRFNELVMTDKKSPAEAYSVVAAELKKLPGARSNRTGESLSEMSARRNAAGN